MPPYYLPTPSVKNRNNYFPQSEPLGPDEMRIIFMGSQPWLAMATHVSFDRELIGEMMAGVRAKGGEAAATNSCTKRMLNKA